MHLTEKSNIRVHHATKGLAPASIVKEHLLAFQRWEMISRSCKIECSGHCEQQLRESRNQLEPVMQMVGQASP
jgi:hypothetical protein